MCWYVAGVVACDAVCLSVWEASVAWESRPVGGCVRMSSVRVERARPAFPFLLCLRL